MMFYHLSAVHFSRMFPMVSEREPTSCSNFLVWIQKTLATSNERSPPSENSVIWRRYSPTEISRDLSPLENLAQHCLVVKGSMRRESSHSSISEGGKVYSNDWKSLTNTPYMILIVFTLEPPSVCRASDETKEKISSAANCVELPNSVSGRFGFVRVSHTAISSVYLDLIPLTTSPLDRADTRIPNNGRKLCRLQHSRSRSRSRQFSRVAGPCPCHGHVRVRLGHVMDSRAAKRARLGQFKCYDFSSSLLAGRNAGP